MNSEFHTRRSRALLALGMMFLALAVVWPMMIPAHALDHGARDFFRGLFYGLSFAFNIGSVALQRSSTLNAPLG